MISVCSRIGDDLQGSIFSAIDRDFATEASLKAADPKIIAFHFDFSTQLEEGHLPNEQLSMWVQINLN